MKKSNIIAIVFLSFAIACGPTDKQAELSALKQKQEEISAQIEQLEAELSTADTSSSNQKESTPVEVAEVSPQAFTHYIHVQGKIDSDNNIMLGSKAAGTIVKVNVKEGDKVRKGEVLAEIDAGILQASRTELVNSLELANTLYERQKSLWDQNIGTEVQFLQAKNNKESLEQRLKSLNEQIELAKIIAPFAGTVDQVLIKKGEVAAPGMPAIRIVNPSDYTLQAEISENYINQIRKNNKVMIELPSQKGKVSSRITSISNVIDPINRTFTIEVEIPDSLNDEVKANMITNIEIADYKNEEAVVVPINAVNFSDKGSYVFLAEDGSAVMKSVNTGKTYNNSIEVLDGLQAGDKIVVTGHKNITDGQLISY